jgi:diadenylate cyclase
MGDLPDPRWPEVIDLLVLSFLAHRLLLLFRGTTTLRVLVGLLVLWLLHAAAWATGLVLTSRFLEALGTVAVLVIVVVFRNEIRDVLVQTSPIRLLLGRPPEHAQEIRPHAAVAAAFHLANTRTGALLVFQNRDALDEHLREGVFLGGHLSTPILESIFVKESPLHDGAVLIRGNRIERVGVILPLTRQTGLPPEYGTRHRAAIGLSEASDAVVVVVSEERGEVALVHRGKVDLVQGPEHLEHALHRVLLWRRHREKPQGWRREVLWQAGGFLATLCVVSAYWGIYLGSQLSLTTITTPIHYRNIPDHLELQSTTSTRVEVQLRGKRPLIDALNPEQVGAFVDLKDAVAGAHQLVRLRAENIEVPLGLEVVRVSPSVLRLDLEPRIEKQVRVDPKLVGSPPRGYRIVRVAVRPEVVKVTGPESIVDALTGVPTLPIDLRGLDPKNRQTTVDAALVLFPASVRLVEGEDKRVQVSIQLAPGPVRAPE